MSVHLVGGGRGGDGAPFAAFAREARARATDAGRERPHIAVVVVRDDDGPEHAETLIAAVPTPVDARITSVAEGVPVPVSAFDGVDGVIVGGGTTPAYLEALLPHADLIRGLIDEGVPYAGFSAGSAIAATSALVGGWRRGGVPVVDEEVGEGLDEVTVRPGLGLTQSTVDVHAAQWGTLARLITAVGEGLVDSGVAIDEHTALVLRPGRAEVIGDGNVWWVDSAGDGVSVRRQPAE